MMCRWHSCQANGGNGMLSGMMSGPWVKVLVCCVSAGPESATSADDLPMPLEYLAVHKEMALAYRLLEANSGLKVTYFGQLRQHD
jgi:hypothetical protein